MTSYIIKNNDFSDRMISSSGGVFISISRYFINNGGIVCGVVFNDDMTSTEYKCVSELSEIRPLLGSKYMDTKSIDDELKNEIHQYLESGKKVLFVGRPCQICLIRKLITHPNLYCCEISCFGVPEDNLWIDYKSGLENEHNSKIKSVIFRDKTYGWNNYHVNIIFENGDTVMEDHMKNSYMLNYLSRKYLKKKCTGCRLGRDIETGADIQIGDAWGVKHISSDDNKGTSVCVSYNRRGDELINILQLSCIVEKINESKMDILKKYNKGLR